MSNLTDHEYAVLMLAGEGNSMIPIGIWEKPILNLTLLGLLKKFDSVNYGITDSGRKMLADRQHEEDDDFKQAFAKLSEDRNAQSQSVQSTNQAAQHLVFAARAAAKLSGKTPEQEVWEIGQGAISRAMELLK